MLEKYIAMTGLVILSMLNFLFCGAAFAICKVPPETMVAYPFQAELGEEECSFVAYKQGGKLEVVVEYPEMKIVKAKAGSDKKADDSPVLVSSNAGRWSGSCCR